MIGEKYPFFDVPEDDVSPLFTTKLQEAAHVGCLRGVLDGNGTTTTSSCTTRAGWSPLSSSATHWSLLSSAWL